MWNNIKKQNLINILFKKNLIKDISNFKEINESCWNQVFYVDNLFIKVSSNKDNLQREYNALKLLNKPYIPKAIFYEKIRNDSVNYYVIWISKLQGRWLEYDWINIDINKKEKLINELVTYIKYINNFKNINWIQTIWYSWTEEIKKWKYKTNPNVNIKSLESPLSEVKTLIEKIKNEQQYLIHNDIWHKNILLKDNKFSGIIDFETSFLSPIRFEYYWLLLTNFYVFTTKCWDSWEFEKEFCKMLLISIKDNYKEVLKQSNKEEFICFCFMSYIKKLWQYDEEWYKHNETLSFMNKIKKYANSVFKNI